MRLVFDLEGNRLLYDITKIHCICCKELKGKGKWSFGPDRIPEALDLLSKADQLIGHNICGFDIPAIMKLYPNFTYKKLKDSLCMSKLFNPERFNGHSLDSYGQQFKRYKPVHEDWSIFSPEMLFRCEEDVEITKMTYEYLVERYCGHWSWLKSLEIEQEFMLYRAAQELEGVDIDVDHALRTVDLLDSEIEELTTNLYELLPLRVIGVGNLDVGTLPFKKDGTYNKTTQEWIDA